MGDVVPLRANQAQPIRSRRRQPGKDQARRNLLAKLQRQSEAVVRTRDWRNAEDLQMLAYLARVAAPHSRSICWLGVRFPLRHGVILRSVRCPESGVGLVAVVC